MNRPTTIDSNSDASLETGPPVTYRLNAFMRWIYGSLYFFLGLLALASLLFPMSPDHGSFATCGEIILKGGMPYRDFWEPKGPACPLTYSLAQTLFGRNMWGVRIVDLLFLGVTLAIIHRFLQRYAGALAAHSGILLYGFIYLKNAYWHTAQPDGWAGMLILIALLNMALSSRCSLKRLFLSGALVGLAAQYKFLYAGALLPLLYTYWQSQAISFRRQFYGIMALGGGFTVVCGLFVGWLAVHQVLGEFIDITFHFNRMVHMAKAGHPISGLSMEVVLRELVAIGRRLYPGFIPVAMIGVLHFRRQRPALAGGLLLLWLFAIALIILQGRYGRYHLLPALGPTVTLTGLGLTGIHRRLAGLTALKRFGTAPGQWIAGAMVIVILVLALPAREHIIKSAQYATGLIDREAYYQKFGSYGGWGFSLAAEMQAADHIRTNSHADDTITIWGFNPLIYYLTGRPPASRFAFNYPLTGSKGTKFFPKYRQEYLRNLESKKPLYIIVDDNDADPYILQTSRDSFNEFSALRSWVLQNYVHTAAIENFDIYRRGDRLPELP